MIISISIIIHIIRNLVKIIHKKLTSFSLWALSSNLGKIVSQAKVGLLSEQPQASYEPWHQNDYEEVGGDFYDEEDDGDVNDD